MLLRTKWGDLLFVIANLARFTNTHAEEALSFATNKFERRFRRLEALMAARGLAPDTADLSALWREAKQTA
jgi:ATP diphosphatase